MAAKKVNGRPVGRQDVRSASGDDVRKLRRQVLFYEETATRFDSHCRGQIPQLDGVKELNKILLSYLRQHGRQRESQDQIYGRTEARIAPDSLPDRQTGAVA